VLSVYRTTAISRQNFFIDVLVCIVDLLHARTSAPSETLSGYSTTNPGHSKEDLAFLEAKAALFGVQALPQLPLHIDEGKTDYILKLFIDNTSIITTLRQETIHYNDRTNFIAAQVTTTVLQTGFTAIRINYINTIDNLADALSRIQR
jgi:hypothetical protein